MTRQRLEVATLEPLVRIDQHSPLGSTLTAQGTVIVHWARQVVADVERLVDAAATLAVEREAQSKGPRCASI